MYNQSSIVVVDDDDAILQLVETALKLEGFQRIVRCPDGAMAMRVVSDERVAAIVLDLHLPGESGEELLKFFSREHPELPVFILTGIDDVDTAVRCLKVGAQDYFVKPVDLKRFIFSLRRVLDLRELQDQHSSYVKRIFSAKSGKVDAFSDIITKNQTMYSIFKYIETISSTYRPVLITGETGVGKELFAKAVHRLSGRKGKFVALNVAGLDDGLFADTLFGHIKGAFTSAESARTGLVEEAADGTLFLDEIGELSISSQLKLLRLIQEREYSQLGSNVVRPFRAGIIVATNKNFDREPADGSFRKDLYFRLRTHHVRIPPLRDRMDDLPLLVNHFLEKAAQSIGKKVPTAPKEILHLLNAYRFPGNIRELESMIYDAVSNHDSGVLSLTRFTENLHVGSASEQESVFAIEQTEKNVYRALQHLPTLKEASDALIIEALQRAKGNQTVAARLLGMKRETLNKRLRRSHS